MRIKIRMKYCEIAVLFHFSALPPKTHKSCTPANIVEKVPKTKFTKI